MSLSPKLDEQSPTIEQNPTSSSALAALLADSYQEVESLRSELSALQKRAEKAERLASSLQALQSATTTTTTTENGNSNNATSSTPFPESATRILMDFEERAVRAEFARDEAEARKRVLMDTWGQLESYLAAVSEAATDARAGYTRIVLEGGGQLVLGQIPTLPGSASGSARHRSRPAGVLGTPVFPSPALPPHAHAHAHSSGVPAAANGSRRPRSPSMDGYHQPPNKKSRGDDRSGYLGDASHAFTYSHEYHYPDPHAPQHTYPPPPPPQHHAQQVIYRSQPYQAQAQPRMILPPHHSRHHHHHHHHHRSPSPRTRSRSRSSSSDTSMSVDEMLLQATTDENGSSLPPPPPPHLNGSSSHRSSRRDRNDPDTNTDPLLSQQQLLQMYIPGAVKHYGAPIPQGGPTVIHHSMPRLPFDRSKYATRPSRNPKRADSGCSEPPAAGVNGYANGSANGSLSANGSGEFQTHIFAPPVTGAPTKKSKFSEPPHPTPHIAGQPPPGTPFPPVNEQGQRICRQCGVAGRYKEGKCVEKWGPGPLGPGTVCDRCRKKMKRVERRGTLEVQQPTQQQDVESSTSRPTPTPARVGSYRPQIRPQKFLQRLNTMPVTRAHSPASASSSVNHSHSTSTSQSETPKPPSPTIQNQNQQAYNTPPPPPKSITMRPPPSPPPAIEALKEDDNEIDMHIPTSEIGRGSEVAAMVRVNGSSVEGRGKGKVKSPLGVDAQGNEAADVRGGEGKARVREGVEDAEAEIEAELVGAVDGSVSGAGKRVATGGRVRDVPMEVDAEADLLEAVEAAAEANTNASKGEEA